MKLDKKSSLAFLEDLDNQLESILKRFDEVELDVLHTRLDEDSWSVIEVLQHLNKTERSSLGYIKYKIEQGHKFNRVGLSHKMKTKFMIKFFNSPIKVKAPNVPGLDPIRESLDYQKIKSEWLEVREELKKFLAELDEDYFSYAIFKHPLSGRISIRQTLAFYEVHIDRHLRQIENILQKES